MAAAQKSVGCEQAQVECGDLSAEQRGGELTDHGREFEAVTGTGTGDQHLRAGWMQSEDEVSVGGVGIHTDLRRAQRTGSGGDVLLQQGLHGSDVVRLHLAPERLGLGLLAFMMDRYLDPLTQIWKTVEEAAWRVFPDEDRAALRLKQLRM